MRPARLRTGMVLATLLALGAPRLQAQSPRCASDDTIRQCWARFFPAPASDARQALRDTAASDEAARLGRKNNGIASLGSGLTSAVNDFLPSIAGAIGFTQATTEDGAASFEKNLLLPFGNTPQRFRLRALLRKPALYAPLSDTLTALGRSGRIDALTRELSDFDDVELSLGWNLENGTFGRSFESFRPLYARLFDAFVGELDTGARNAANAALASGLPDDTTQIRPELRADAECGGQIADNTVEELRLSCLLPAEAERLTGLLETAAAANAAVEAQLAERLERGGFHEFGDLIDNQPQLSVEAAADLRRDLIGPGGVRATVRYEGGFTNVNGLRQRCGGTAAITPDCLQRYLESPGVRPALRRGDRFFVTASFVSRSRLRLSVPEDTLLLLAPGTWDLSASAGYGRYVAFDRAGEGVARLDLSAEYVQHHDDPARQNRLVLTGTFTQRVSAGLSLAAGVSYANRPEFLGAVDKQVSANFGLRYKLTRD